MQIPNSFSIGKAGLRAADVPALPVATLNWRRPGRMPPAAAGTSSSSGTEAPPKWGSKAQQQQQQQPSGSAASKFGKCRCGSGQPSQVRGWCGCGRATARGRKCVCLGRGADARPAGARCVFRFGAIQDCCGPVLSGAWARTAPELSRARYTAAVLGDAAVLADTTHPESLAAIGNRSSLMRKANIVVQGYQYSKPQLVDMVHQPDPEKPDTWWVLQALAGRQPNGSDYMQIIAETYVKEGGRWLFFGPGGDIPNLQPFADFFQRYDREDPFVGPRHGQYEFNWAQLPPRANRRRLPWLEDRWPAAADDQQEEAGKPAWAYLDTARDPETEMTAAETAASFEQFLEQQAFLGGLQSQLDYDSWYFRHGRFMQ